MAWRRSGDKPLFEPMVVYVSYAYKYVINNYIYHKVRDEITNTFPNFNGTGLVMDNYFQPTLYWDIWLLIHIGILVNPCK